MRNRRSLRIFGIIGREVFKSGEANCGIDGVHQYGKSEKYYGWYDRCNEGV